MTLSASHEEPSSLWKILMFILYIRRYRNWVHKPAHENILTIWRSVLPDSPLPEQRVPHAWSPPWTPFWGYWKSAAAAAHNLILVELDGKCPWQMPICSWYEQGTKRFEIKAVLDDQFVVHGQYFFFFFFLTTFCRWRNGSLRMCCFSTGLHAVVAEPTVASVFCSLSLESEVLTAVVLYVISPMITIYSSLFSWIQFTQSCPTLCDHMDCSTPGFPVYHQLPELTQTHVHWIGDAIQPSHLLLSPFPPTFNLSQHQGLFIWVSSSHQVAKGLEFQLQHQSFQWIFRTDFL